MNGNYIIVFNAGSYGSFISWYCLWLQGKFNANERPWSKANTAHGWTRENFFDSIDEAISNKTMYGMVHPKTTSHCSLIQVLDRLLTAYSKIIFLYPDDDTMIWNINNKHDKVYMGEWKNFIFDPKRSTGNWLEYQLKSNEDIINWTQSTPQNWQIREWLSYYSLSQHKSEVDVESISDINNTNILKISMSDLRDRFQLVTESIHDFLGIAALRTNHEISTLYDDWAEKQIHKHKDSFVSDVINCILADQDADMRDLTLVDQAEIQRVLRDKHGIELKCFGLDNWPSSVYQLTPFLLRHE